MSTNRIIFIISICCFLFSSSCNLFEEPYQMSFRSGNLFGEEYIILSKLNGKRIHHTKLPRNTKMTLKELNNSTFHLTSVDIFDLDSSSIGSVFQVNLTTFLNVPAGDYELQEGLATCCSILPTSYYVKVENIGDFTPTQKNPFYANSGETISYDPSNGGTLFAKISSANDRAYIAFNLDDDLNRKYFYQNYVERNDTITIDYSTLPSFSTSTKIKFDDTYTHSHCTVDGYEESREGNSFTPFRSSHFASASEIDVFIPPVTDFDFFWTNVWLSKSGRVARSYDFASRSNTLSEIPKNINFPDWTFTVEDKRISCPKVSTIGDFDYVELKYNFNSDGFSESLAWTIFAPKALLIEIPQIDIPSELLTNHPKLSNIENLELEYVRLIAHPDIDNYNDFIEFALISNENYDRYTYEILSGR